jgi:hypothetical protein
LAYAADQQQEASDDDITSESHNDSQASESQAENSDVDEAKASHDGDDEKDQQSDAESEQEEEQEDDAEAISADELENETLQQELIEKEVASATTASTNTSSLLLNTSATQTMTPVASSSDPFERNYNPQRIVTAARIEELTNNNCASSKLHKIDSFPSLPDEFVFARNLPRKNNNNITMDSFIAQYDDNHQQQQLPTRFELPQELTCESMHIHPRVTEQ